MIIYILIIILKTLTNFNSNQLFNVKEKDTFKIVCNNNIRLSIKKKDFLKFGSYFRIVKKNILIFIISYISN